MKEKLKTLWNLYFTMFKIGSVTFGGGYAMLPILERELIEKRKWTTDEELMNWYAISQVTPGVIAVNVSTFIGQKFIGAIGGIISTLGIVTPSIIIITIIALFINNFAEIVRVQKALTGINVAVAAILSKAAFTFAKKSIKNVLGIVLFLISFILIFFFKVNTVWIILGSALLGVVIAGCRGDYKKTLQSKQNTPENPVKTNATSESAEEKKND